MMLLRDAPAFAILWLGDNPPPSPTALYRTVAIADLPEGKRGTILARPDVTGNRTTEINIEEWLTMIDLLVDGRPPWDRTPLSVANAAIARVAVPSNKASDKTFWRLLREGVVVSPADLLAHRLSVATSLAARDGRILVRLPVRIGMRSPSTERIGQQDTRLAAVAYPRRQPIAILGPEHVVQKFRPKFLARQEVPEIALHRSYDTLVTASGLVIDAGLALEENNLGPTFWRNAEQRTNPHLHLLSPRIGLIQVHPCERTLEADCIVLAGGGAENYGHFLTDRLARILLAAPHLEPGFNVVTAAPAGAMADRLVEVMNVIGIDHSRLVLLRRDEILRCRQVITINGISTHPQWVHPTAFRAVREVGLKAATGVDSRNWADKIVVFDRGPGASRRLVNINKVQKLAERRGWPVAVIDPGLLTFAEQVAAAASARAVFGVMGAGATNAMFARAGTPFVVFTNEVMPGWYFQNLADLAKLPYILVRGEALACDAGATTDSDYAVMENDIERALDYLVSLMGALPS